MTQAAMRAAVVAGIETRQEAARAAALRGEPFAACSWREAGRQREDALRARANVEARERRVSAAAAKSACPSPTVQNEEQMGRIAARREFRLRELATRPPSGKSLSKGEQASKRPRGARGKFESKPTAAVVSAIAHAGAAIAISPTAISAAAMLTACVTIPAARFSAPATLAAECTFVRFC